MNAILTALTAITLLTSPIWSLDQVTESETGQKVYTYVSEGFIRYESNPLPDSLTIDLYEANKELLDRIIKKNQK